MRVQSHDIKAYDRAVLRCEVCDRPIPAATRADVNDRFAEVRSFCSAPCREQWFERTDQLDDED